MTKILFLWYILMGNNTQKRLKTKDLCLFAVLGALTFAAKFAMAGLPNMEPVSLFVMAFAVTFGKKAVYPIGIYILLEYLFYGLHLWSINYLYIWFILAFAAWKLRGMEERFGWGVLSGFFGLLFGFFCVPVMIAVGGVSYAFAWWASGIPFDLAHAASNFALAFVLFLPLRRLLERLYHRNGECGR